MNRIDIALVGMAGRFPGAADVAELWSTVVGGRETIRDLTEDELRAAGVDPDEAAEPGFVPRVADLAEPDRFDAGFFGMSAQEARLTDPQHRVFLECAWSALENAALNPADLDGNIGVWASTSMSSYLMNHLLDGTESELAYPMLVGNDKDFLASRVAYKLDLTGPTVGVQTACSSSLVGVHLAAQALRSGDCDAALAGGVSITLPQNAGYRHKTGGILSPDGRCRPFDADSAGTVKGNGCAVVVLMRLDDAIAGRYPIRAVLRGSAVGNDGARRAGFPAPSPRGQSRIIAEALDRSGLRAADVGYIEAHGTGTALGDPIEIRALTRAYDDGSDPREPTALGSIKANVGHLDAAAGVTGLIKTVLVLEHQTIPPQVNLTSLNPAIELDEERYRIPLQATEPETPIEAAAVSSFGLGGTNVHCVLAVAPPGRPVVPDHEPRLIVLSARDRAGLERTAGTLLEHLARHPGVRFADLSYTLLRGRARLAHRLAFVARDVAHTRQILTAFVAAGEIPAAHPDAERWLADGTLPEAAPDARRIPVPGYAFLRERHWAEAQVKGGAGGPAVPGDVAATVTEVMSRHLGVPGLDPEGDFYDLGGDSMTAVEIVAELRERLDRDMSLQDFENLRSPASVIRFLTAPADPSAEPIEVTAMPRRRPLAVAERLRVGSGTPIFFFPPGRRYELLLLPARPAPRRHRSAVHPVVPDGTARRGGEHPRPGRAFHRRDPGRSARGPVPAGRIFFRGERRGRGGAAAAGLRTEDGGPDHVRRAPAGGVRRWTHRRE